MTTIFAKVWRPEQPHVAVRQLRDWFAQFPYLSKLREPQGLARAISKEVARSDAKYAAADRFDEAKTEYVGLKFGRLVEVDLNSETLLVRADVAQAQIAKTVQPATPTSGGPTTGDKPPQIIGDPPRPSRGIRDGFTPR